MGKVKILKQGALGVTPPMMSFARSCRRIVLDNPHMDCLEDCPFHDQCFTATGLLRSEGNDRLIAEPYPKEVVE